MQILLIKFLQEFQNGTKIEIMKLKDLWKTFINFCYSCLQRFSSESILTCAPKSTTTWKKLSCRIFVVFSSINLNVDLH